ncbi:SufE family protein [Kordiimonas sp. SCSIO 12603]|uniref:SufE family protein n=1 Tax=Kordiimonas sp. SCSIO 12603 TaxID=2829596 RepID=UPI002106400C|nr:SufE family protein [Kordiimonas sp. SCSIO 12603]UTW58614.1 SufE family protein [Kordiimonas sp. SCSIO 12603]
MSLENTTIVEILDTFEFLDDWEERYKYIIDLGKKLTPLAPEEMVDENKVRGCQSQVWLVAETDVDGKIHLRGDSDAFIVKGLVAVVLLIFSGKTAAEIQATNAKEILDQMGLSAHLSPLRANGLFSMVERIERMAA